MVPLARATGYWLLNGGRSIFKAESDQFSGGRSKRKRGLSSVAAQTLGGWLRKEANSVIFSRENLGVAATALLVLGSLLLAACGSAPSQPAASATIDETTTIIGTQPSTPEDAVRALIAAVNERDWQQAYALYASPQLAYDAWLAECVQSEEVYEDFALHETTLVSETLALVRVTYRVETTPPGGERYSVVVTEPGEDWRVEKVDGLWKVGWLPRQ